MTQMAIRSVDTCVTLCKKSNSMKWCLRAIEGIRKVKSISSVSVHISHARRRAAGTGRINYGCILYSSNECACTY
jgi:hypothetical protein